MSSPPPRPPPFQDFHNSGLKGKKMVAAPLTVMLHGTIRNDDF